MPSSTTTYSTTREVFILSGACYSNRVVVLEVKAFGTYLSVTARLRCLDCAVKHGGVGLGWGHGARKGDTHSQ